MFPIAAVRQLVKPFFFFFNTVLRSSLERKLWNTAFPLSSVSDFFFWASSVSTSLASHKFPPEHRLLLLLAGPFLLFFAFYTFFALAFSHFFRLFFSSFFVVPVLVIRKANRQQQTCIFFASTGDAQPCDAPPSRLPLLAWISVWPTWPKTAASLLSLQPHVPRF